MDVPSLLTSAGIGSGTLATAAQGLASSGMFSGETLIASFIISTIGFAYFIYGKKTGKIISLICGILLMGFPYFVYNITYMIIITVILCGIPFFVKG
ncbi:hypothetical protein P148_SR1C00001G0322 [candidate division SR1 bacterium RAAC1_SR1_1]|nr:hypothetical protein P148_SR1C00001G0322 [candidate division SR1 bacterium RAAC1_SR1_1]